MGNVSAPQRLSENQTAKQQEIKPTAICGPHVCATEKAETKLPQTITSYPLGKQVLKDHLWMENIQEAEFYEFQRKLAKHNVGNCCGKYDFIFHVFDCNYLFNITFEEKKKKTLNGL